MGDGAAARRTRRRQPKPWSGREPDFITKTELAYHLGCDISSIDPWIEDRTIPPPHARPGERYPIWLRKHYNVFKSTGVWPREAYDPD